MALPYTREQRAQAQALLDQIGVARNNERDLFHARRIANLGRRLASAANAARQAEQQAIRFNEDAERLGRNGRHDGP